MGMIGSMHGTYVRGWKFDWEDAATDVKKYRALGRHDMADACADPGCLSCPQCGELHWREYEVFLCCRCGAEITISHYREPDGSVLGKLTDKVVAGLPSKPEMVRKKLFEGMRVRYLGKKYIDSRTKKTKVMAGLWPAGTIQPGECGTIKKGIVGRLAEWKVEFDGRVPEQEDMIWGLLSDFLDDEEFEEIA